MPSFGAGLQRPLRAACHQAGQLSLLLSGWRSLILPRPYKGRVRSPIQLFLLSVYMYDIRAGFTFMYAFHFPFHFRPQWDSRRRVASCPLDERHFDDRRCAEDPQVQDRLECKKKQEETNLMLNLTSVYMSQ